MIEDKTITRSTFGDEADKWPDELKKLRKAGWKMAFTPVNRDIGTRNVNDYYLERETNKQCNRKSNAE